MQFKISDRVILKSTKCTQNRKCGQVVGFTKTKVKVKWFDYHKVQSVEFTKLDYDLDY